MGNEESWGIPTWVSIVGVVLFSGLLVLMGFDSNTGVSLRCRVEFANGWYGEGGELRNLHFLFRL